MEYYTWHGINIRIANIIIANCMLQNGYNYMCQTPLQANNHSDVHNFTLHVQSTVQGQLIATAKHNIIIILFTTVCVCVCVPCSLIALNMKKDQV